MTKIGVKNIRLRGKVRKETPRVTYLTCLCEQITGQDKGFMKKRGGKNYINQEKRNIYDEKCPENT